jgi:hypothetical protein
MSVHCDYITKGVNIMNSHHYFQTHFFKGLLAVLFALALFALTPGLAKAQSPYSDCNPIENCTANDFGAPVIHDVVVVQNGCVDHDNNSATPTAVLLNFKLSYTARSATRYDIGSLLALDGGTAMRDDYLTGSCYRDWLPAPLTATDPSGAGTLWPVSGSFWDGEGGGDLCGDVPSNDTATRPFNNVYIACVDNDNNGQIDINLCLIYDNNAQNLCTTLPDPTTGTTAKCQCLTVNVPVTPTAIEGLSFSASSRALPVGLALSGMGLALIGGVLLSIYLRRRAHA